MNENGEKIQIRNSTVDFLVFTKQNSEDGIDVRIQDDSVWLTQEGLSQLFDKGRTTITEHLKHIFEEGELVEGKIIIRSFIIWMRLFLSDIVLTLYEQRNFVSGLQRC